MRTDWLSEKRLATLVQLRRTADAILRYNRGNRGGKERTLPHSRSRDVNEPEQTNLIAASLRALQLYDVPAGHEGAVDNTSRCARRPRARRARRPGQRRPPQTVGFGWLRAVVRARVSSAPQGGSFEGAVRSTEN